MNIQENQPVKILVNGKLYEVVVQDSLSTPMTVLVNGKAYSVEFEAAQPGEAAKVSLEPRPAAPKPVAAPAPTPVMPKPAAAKPAAPAPATDGGTMRAPMPGTILDIMVKPGDAVKAGQTLCFLEAMKMKNAIRANRDAVVAAVHVSMGESVPYNAPLFSFE